MFSDDLMDSQEQSFLDLVEFSQSKEGFIRNAKDLLGADWAEAGKQIVQEHNPGLMDKFKSYLDGSKFVVNVD